jgi:hypothetical protein
MVVLKTRNDVMFFMSVMQSEIRRFIFTVIRLFDDHIAAVTFVGNGFRHRTMAALRAVEGPKFSNIDVTLIASRELVGNMRIGTAIGPRS